MAGLAGMGDLVATCASELSRNHMFGRHIGEGMTVQECIEISSTPRGWNSTFDRRQIPLMRKLAHQHLLP